jgi:hypothetical protein
MKTEGILITLVAVFLLAQAACAEKVLSVFFVVHANDSVELKQAKVIDGKTSSQIQAGNYGIEVKDMDNKKTLYAESLKLGFITDEEQPKAMNYTLVTLRIPYNSEMGYLHIYKGGKRIFSQRIFGKNDSENTPVSVMAKKEDAGYASYFLVPFFILSMAAVIMLYRKKQAQKIKKEREDFLRWKEAQERLRNAEKPDL